VSLSLLPVPSRRRGEEILDRPGLDPRIVRRALVDIAKANALFGGTAAVLAELETAAPDLPQEASLLDVATGSGDIPRSARKLFLDKHGISLTTIGLDSAEELARMSRTNLHAVVRANALRLPFPSRSVDIITCSQFLHHLDARNAATLVQEMNRVARIRVVISDLRRSWIAVGGLWLASFPLRFDPVSRYDGVLSIMRGFTREELREIVARAIGAPARVTYRRGFRITASWAPVAT
jgi:2-polyprenyl-3-methyl-5-hydroxy-6-metoxy-1,4-benzoquinol methylase